MISHIELTNSKQDRELLRDFYQELYVIEFPDPDERESLENMERYLELKTQGWYGKNNYHITIGIQDGKPIAGVIADYLAEANSGVIEFLVVAPEFRHRKIGKAILEITESLLLADAKQHLGRNLDCIVAEMNDPFKTTSVRDNVDPAKRTLIWKQWGYDGLDFPYIQPALSNSQQPASNLLLIAKIFRETWSQSIPSVIVKAIVHEYLRWAMRIETPKACAEYRDMVAFLDERPEVPVLRLDSYIGCDTCKPIHIRDVTNPTETDFAAVISIYQKAFPPSLLTVEPQKFAQALTLMKQLDRTSFHYHLWAIRATAEAKVEGMASFFAFPAAGFGGYVAFTGSLRGTWRLRSLLARLEQQMLQDLAASKAEGWYIETDLARKPSLLLRLGFFEVDVDYEQPPLAEGQVSSRIRLCYKPFGRVYGKPKVKRGEFLDAVGQLFQIVYGIDSPRQHPSYHKLEMQVALFSDGWVRFR